MKDTGTIPRLGVNIDHLATLRQLRGTPYPDLVETMRIVERAGGEQITVHLREDRRHIQDQDVKDLRAQVKVALNLEMAATDAMVGFACRVGPDWVCLVPEKRQEVTTEGGLDLSRNPARIARAVTRLKKSGIRVSLFVEPTVAVVRKARAVGADAVELHTGRYCLATQSEGARSQARARRELDRIRKAAEAGIAADLHVHAGHGFDYVNVRAVVAEVSGIEEYNIGHSIVCRAALVGMERAVREMVSAIAAP